MEGTCCLCTIFLKKMSILLDMLWVPLSWLQWASAPPNNATVAQLSVHWSLLSLFTPAPLTKPQGMRFSNFVIHSCSIVGP